MHEEFVENATKTFKICTNIVRIPNPIKSINVLNKNHVYTERNIYIVKRIRGRYVRIYEIRLKRKTKRAQKVNSESMQIKTSSDTRHKMRLVRVFP